MTAVCDKRQGKEELPSNVVDWLVQIRYKTDDGSPILRHRNSRTSFAPQVCAFIQKQSLPPPPNTKNIN